MIRVVQLKNAFVKTKLKVISTKKNLQIKRTEVFKTLHKTILSFNYIR